MARILASGVYLADRQNSAPHLLYEFSRSASHQVVQRWAALSIGGQGRSDLPLTELVVTEPTPKFILLDRLTEDAQDFDWLVLCDDDVEVGPDFIDRLIDHAQRYDFALSQPARTADSYTDHPIVQVMPGLIARRTRFVEIGPVICVRRDAIPLLLPFGGACGMGWGLDFVWPTRLERAGLRLGIIDAAPVAHRIRRPAANYERARAERDMRQVLAAEAHLSAAEAFTILEIYT